MGPKALVNYNERLYTGFGRDLEAAKATHKPEHTDASAHLEALDKSSAGYKTAAFNKSLSEFRLKTLDGQGEIRVIKLQGLHTLNRTDNKACVSLHGGANLGLSARIDAEALGNFGTNCVMFFVDYRYAPHTKWRQVPWTNRGCLRSRQRALSPEKYGIVRNHIAAGGRSSGDTFDFDAAIMINKNTKIKIL